jgi:hypothetical protein
LLCHESTAKKSNLATEASGQTGGCNLNFVFAKRIIHRADTQEQEVEASGRQQQRTEAHLASPIRANGILCFLITKRPMARTHKETQP